MKCFSPRTNRLLGVTAASIVLLTAPTKTRAADLFTITATGGPTVTVGANNVIDLIERAVNRSDAFAALVGGVTGSLNYGGVANAITYTSAAAGSSTITIPIETRTIGCLYGHSSACT